VTRRTARQGFTLVELVVALALTGLAALLAARTWTAVAEGSEAARAAREALDRRSNAHRWLARAIRSLDVDPARGGFAGEPARLRFGTWLERPEGWLEPGRVEILADDGMLLAISSADTIVLAGGVIEVAFDYLLEPGADTRWARRWVSPLSAPLAIRLRVAYGAPPADTLLFLVGERG
jgi:prepilin-type N-terminal cleavage/methylation domain-containing protein